MRDEGLQPVVLGLLSLEPKQTPCILSCFDDANPMKYGVRGLVQISIYTVQIVIYTVGIIKSKDNISVVEDTCEVFIVALLHLDLVVKSFKAPMTVIALRGTLLRGPTIRIDVKDDLTLFTTENLGCSYRFHRTIEAVRRSVEKYGSSEVSMAGHSLGAGVALSVGRALAVDGIFIETHLLNPSSVSLPLALRCVGDKVGMLLKVTMHIFLPLKRKRNNDKQ